MQISSGALISNAKLNVLSGWAGSSNYRDCRKGPTIYTQRRHPHSSVLAMVLALNPISLIIISVFLSYFAFKLCVIGTWYTFQKLFPTLKTNHPRLQAKQNFRKMKEDCVIAGIGSEWKPCLYSVNCLVGWYVVFVVVVVWWWEGTSTNS